MSVIECLDCAVLLERPADLSPGEEALYEPFKPAKPRPIDAHSTPRRPRCTTHWRAADKARKAAQSAARSRKRSGLDDDTRAALWTIQGRRCPCGRQPSRGVPDADHDHQLARLHEHAEDVACQECMRGFLCRQCNRELVGRYSAEQLRSVLAYLEDPPMRRLERAREMVADLDLHVDDATRDCVVSAT